MKYNIFMKLPMDRTDTFKYFRAYLLNWADKNGLSQSEIALRFSMYKSNINEIIHEKKGVSLPTIEKMCRNMGVNIVDALIKGRILAGEVAEEDQFSIKEIEAIEAFKICLKIGGDATEIITDQVLRLAEKKKSEMGFSIENQDSKLSKSA